jgi:hypothetical protein
MPYITQRSYNPAYRPRTRFVSPARTFLMCEEGNVNYMQFSERVAQRRYGKKFDDLTWQQREKISRAVCNHIGYGRN